MSLLGKARMVIVIEQSLDYTVQCAYVMFAGWFVNVDRGVSNFEAAEALSSNPTSPLVAWAFGANLASSSRPNSAAWRNAELF